MDEIYTMTSRMLNQSKMLDVVSHNMANVNTTGFKKQNLEFQSVLDDSQKKAEHPSSYSTVTKQTNDFSQGVIKVTNNNTDITINGDGFFAIKRNNQTVYSRNGHFLLNPTGQLVNTLGEKVLGVDKQPIDIPVGTKIKITPQGEVKDSNGAMYGQIGIFKFENKSNLIYAGNSSFASPIEPTLNSKTLLITGTLESSNVNAINESVNLTNVSRAYESAARLIKTFEDLETKSIQQLYKVQ